MLADPVSRLYERAKGAAHGDPPSWTRRQAPSWTRRCRPPPDFRDYLRWVGRHRPAPKPSGPWRGYLAELDQPTLVAGDRTTAPRPAAQRYGARAAAGVPAGGPGRGDRPPGLRELTRRLGVDAVHRAVHGVGPDAARPPLGIDDVVFGSHRVGPPPPRWPARTGWSACCSTPCRCGRGVRPGEPLAELLRRAFREQGRLTEHHHLGLGQLQRAVGHPTLFDTLYVFRKPAPGTRRPGSARWPAPGIGTADRRRRPPTTRLTLDVNPGGGGDPMEITCEKPAGPRAGRRPRRGTLDRLARGAAGARRPGHGRPASWSSRTTAVAGGRGADRVSHRPGWPFPEPGETWRQAWTPLLLRERAHRDPGGHRAGVRHRVADRPATWTSGSTAWPGCWPPGARGPGPRWSRLALPRTADHVVGDLSR